MGGYDIFVSKRISDTEWGIPENIGYPVNTTDDNLFFVPSKEDKKGYYVLDPEEEPHIALVDLNKKVEEPVEESKTKEEMASVVPVKPATDSISKPIVKAIEKPEIKPEDILHNITGTISFSDNNPDMDNTFLIIKNKAGVAINTIKLSPEGKYKTQLKYGSYSFLFTASGYNKFKKPVIISANNLNDVEVNVTLFPEQVVKQKAKEKVFEKPKIISSGSSINNHYTIQICALNKVVQLSAFKNINNVEYNIGTDSLVRYYWGYFNSKTEACSQLRTIIDKGYRDAFIVPFSKFNNDSINPGYTVQVFASFHEIDTSRFGSLQDLRIFRGNNRYVRCTSGKFENYYDAYKYLLEVIVKGYSDAFIRRFDELSRL
jgi:hypothetical protein